MCCNYYVSNSDRELTLIFLSFELKYLVSRHVSIIMRIPKSCLFVCPYPKKRNHPIFVNITPTVAIDISIERSSRVLQHENPKIDFLDAYLSVSAAIFCKQSLAYVVQIDRCYHAIHKHSSSSQHISVLTTCTFMFLEVCTIEPSFFKTTSGVYRRPFESRHLFTL